MKISDGAPGVGLDETTRVGEAAAKALVQQQFQGYYTANPAASFAAQVWTNNVWVAAQSLIYGILLGIPTIFVLLENAVNGGVNAGYLFAHGKGTLFFSLILPHGMLELSGVFLAAVRTGVAVKPAEYTWRQLAGAGALAGIGFTMSLFIAGQAFPIALDFSAAKIAVFAASILSAVIGTALLWGASRQELIEEAPPSASMQVS